jgi:hypothetical protein
MGRSKRPHYWDTPTASAATTLSHMKMKIPSGPIPGNEWIDVPGTDGYRGTAWHYTGANGLLGILSNREIWASGTTALNDRSELSYGLGVLQAAWAEIKTDSTSSVHPKHAQLIESIVTVSRWPVYVVCGTEDSDSLNQWMHYGKSQGFAVGFDASDMTSLGPVVEEDPKVFPGTLQLGWVKVIYQPVEQRELAEECLRFVVKHFRDDSLNGAFTRTDSLLLGLASRFKHPAFKAEREVRYVYSPVPGLLVERFREGPRGLIPYIPIRRPNKLGHFTLDLPLDDRPHLPISGVACGPTWSEERELSRGTVDRLLHSVGLNVPVAVSDIPYRHG